MTSSIDSSSAAELQPLADLLEAWRESAGNQPVLLVGAAARDLLLVHVHRVAVFRATEDTDLAVAVPDWDCFQAIRDALTRSGRFEPAGPSHRLWFGRHRVDLVPFGGIERRDRRIAWPAPAGEVMNVWGFSEAMAAAVTIELRADLVVKVASLPALALLKLSAWKERRYETSKTPPISGCSSASMRRPATRTGSLVPKGWQP